MLLSCSRASAREQVNRTDRRRRRLQHIARPVRHFRLIQSILYLAFINIFDIRYLFRYYLIMGKIRRGNYVFVTWIGDHRPRHVHVYSDGKLIVTWDIEHGRAMK